MIKNKMAGYVTYGILRKSLLLGMWGAWYIKLMLLKYMVRGDERAIWCT